MIPPLIVMKAVESNIHLIAITDHNASANILAVQQAAEGYDLTVLPGMELQTREEVHVLCLFDDVKQILEFQNFVDEAMPDMVNQPDFFGEQFIVDKTGEFIRNESRLLLTSANISFKDAWIKVATLGGLFIPAHVNRKGFGLVANLGFVPEDIPVEALEISRHIEPSMVPVQFPQLKGYPLIQSGDVHGVEEFLGSTLITIEKPTIAEIKLALHRMDNRTVEIIPRSA
jgi:3',5'-nucleoside bisphosphate phosphatase